MESTSESIIMSFYESLASGDVSKISSMLTEDLEWRFHGPPQYQYLMRMLTGADRIGSFVFNPSRICAIGDKVFAEGRSNPVSISNSKQQQEEIFWVQVWTVDPNTSRIVELNECFNTSVTVTSPPSCYTVWQSQATRRSMPGLVFAM